MFVLHPQLDQDTAAVCTLGLCRVLVMNDSRFPWLILVPERPDITEIHDLGAEDRTLLMEEITCAGKVLHDMFRPRKINVGALGNLVPQLHIHVVARNAGDAAWPGPVWGHSKAVAYKADELEAIVEKLTAALI
jgi:diadenosine tetraphosphate (Ap4A) HIT family hydrolase